MTAYYRHRRHAHRGPKRARLFNDFIAIQNTRLGLATKAFGFVTFGANIADGKTVVIDSKTYTFQATLTEADGHVKIGATAAASATNLAHAIAKSGGVAGTDYANAVVAHTTVDATDLTNGRVRVTAKATGTAGNSKAITTNDTNVTVSATLAKGQAASTSNVLAYLSSHSADQVKAALTRADVGGT